MSSASTAWAWEQIKGGHVSGVAALVLLKLSDRADDDGKCWPGHKRTAEDCNINVRSARRAIADLQAAGLLKKEARQRTGKNGADQSNYYFVGVAGGEGNTPIPPEGIRPTPRRAIGPSPDGHKTHQNHKDESNNLKPPPQPPAAAAVVVVKEEDLEELVWPAGLAENQLSSMRGVLRGKDWPGLANAQALLDELAGQLQLGKVRNPPGLLRRLLERQREGTFTEELGPEVRRAREARRKHQEREAAALAGAGKSQEKQSEVLQVSGASEAALRERRRLRELRKTFRN